MKPVIAVARHAKLRFTERERLEAEGYIVIEVVGAPEDVVRFESVSRRDWFAMAALTAQRNDQEYMGSDEKRAAWAYEMADAMLAERAKR